MLSFIFEMADMTVLPTDVENCSSLDSQQTLVFHSLSICHMPGISLNGVGATAVNHWPLQFLDIHF